MIANLKPANRGCGRRFALSSFAAIICAISLHAQDADTRLHADGKGFPAQAVTESVLREWKPRAGGK